MHLGPVQQTLLVPLWARAQEAHEAVPILLDPKAAAIYADLAYDFSPLENAHASRVGCCVRGRLVDSWVREFLLRHPHGTIVELGCGLNGRFERVDNGLARWIDLDLPDVMELRRRFFDEGPRRTSLAASVLDDAWIEHVAAEAQGHVLFVSEGMFVYLHEEEVRSVFERLAARFPGAQIAFDAMTPLVLRHQEHHDAMRHFAARFTWAVPDARIVESWDGGIRIEASRRFYDLLYERARRLPRVARWLGRALAVLYPPLKRAYTLNLARLGIPPDAAPGSFHDTRLVRHPS